MSFLLLFLASSGFANVTLTNGNFFVSYVDALYPGGFEPKIERVYNSKNGQMGLFGWGWGSDIEVKAIPAPDGSLIIHEYGNAAAHRFSAKGTATLNLDALVERMTKAAQGTGSFNTGNQMQAYRAHLKADVHFRNEQWARLLRLGKVEPTPVRDGEWLYSDRLSYTQVQKINGGYQRVYDTGLTQRFDQNGRLTRVMDRNKHFIDLTYRKDGSLERIMDDSQRRMFFEFNAKGLVSQIKLERNESVTYQYNALNELVRVKNAKGAVYEYGYDATKRHNLNLINYGNGAKLQVEYYPLAQKENVKMVRDPDGNETRYTYGDPRDKMHQRVEVGSYSKDGQELLKQSFEYFKKNKSSGEPFTARLIQTHDGESTDTTYNEQELPTSIKTKDGETRFEYDPSGRLLKKTTPIDETQVTYDPKIGKSTKITLVSLPTKTAISSTDMTYDSKGRLKEVRNQSGAAVQLFYDGGGRIVSMLDEKKRRLDLKYNELSQPTEISDPSLGKVDIQYANNGDVKDVFSTKGKDVSSSIITLFQNLQSLLKPSGVSLSP
jgi:YD repeat-containing protein